MNADRCGSCHPYGKDCIRPQNHLGFCWSSWEHQPGGSVVRTEWASQDGQYLQHATHRIFYPENARERQNG